jgi:diguanylate cyclase (GGDEF)-like protein
MAVRASCATIEELDQRARQAASEQERADCLNAIEGALVEAAGPGERAALLMCRARVHSSQWQTRRVVDDALAAMAMFEEAGEEGRALDAASLAAAFASRLGDLSLASELATKAIVGLATLHDDGLAAEIYNRLGIFCYSFLDYDRATENFEASLVAAERCGDKEKTYRQLQNIADALLLAARTNRATKGDRRDETGAGSGDLRGLERADETLTRLEQSAPIETRGRFGTSRVRAEYLLEMGRVKEAFEALVDVTRPTGAVHNAQKAAFARVASQCLRLLGRAEDALVAAEEAVRLAETSNDDLELMLVLEERSAAREAAGDTAGALADLAFVKSRLWAVHQRQTAQVVEQVWVRAAMEQEQRLLEESTAAAIRTAEEDALTGVGNRRMLERSLSQPGLDSAELAIVMVDIDHFKEINDTFGHAVGDLVLRALGDLFRTEARSGQVVVRYGGEEFVFAVPSASLRTAAAFAERIRHQVASYDWAQVARSLAVTVSLGVASGSPEAWRSIVADADSALYAAKRSGRNRVETALTKEAPLASPQL